MKSGFLMIIHIYAKASFDKLLIYYPISERNTAVFARFCVYLVGKYVLLGIIVLNLYSIHTPERTNRNLLLLLRLLLLSLPLSKLTIQVLFELFEWGEDDQKLLAVLLAFGSLTNIQSSLK